MKKILISIIIFILLVLAYLMSFKSFKIGSFKIDSIDDIKQMNSNLNNKFSEAEVLSKNTYPKGVETLDNAIRKLTNVKNQYLSKSSSSIGEDGLLATYLKSYKIETLMVDLGRYKNKNGLEDLRLDLKTSSKANDIYDLQLTLVGPYDSIYNFMYDVENDDDLKFQISNLIIEPYMLKTKTITTIEDRSKSKTEYPYNIKETITTSGLGDGANSNSSTTNNTTKQAGGTVAINNINPQTTSNNSSTSSSSSTKTDVVYDPKNVQAQFTVESISISFN